MKLLLENGKEITIDDQNEIARGGEGRIMSIPEMPDKVAKIFLLPDKTITRMQKDALSVLDAHFFVKPELLIYPPKGGMNYVAPSGWAGAGKQAGSTQDIVGYTMQWLPLNFIPLASLFNKPYCAKHRVDTTFKIRVLENMQRAMQMAHQQQIVIGDFSGLNTMVNPQADIKLIDVDSYQTSAQVHSHYLLDDIRDYLYQGRVSIHSDYFAFSVLAFNMLTFTHPFKGIHQSFQTLAERMIHKIPIFKKDPLLTVPKVYEPISQAIWQAQFEDFYLEGKRYSLSTSLSQVPAQAAAPPPPILQVSDSQELTIKPLLDLKPEEEIIDAQFNGGIGFISTTQRHFFLNTANNGFVQQIAALPSNGQEYCFVGQERLLKKDGEQLLAYDQQMGFVPIQNFSFKTGSRFMPFGAILAVVEENFLKYLQLDQIIQNNLATSQTQVHGKGFIVRDGLVQNVGGKQYIFYNSGKTLTTVAVRDMVYDVKVVGNCGIAAVRKRIQNKAAEQEMSLEYRFFNIQNMEMGLSSVAVSALKTFGYRPIDAQHGLIFEACDDVLNIRRSQDFAVLQSLACKVLNEQSLVYSTPAGIVAVNPDAAYLLNKR